MMWVLTQMMQVSTGNKIKDLQNKCNLEYEVPEETLKENMKQSLKTIKNLTKKKMIDKILKREVEFDEDDLIIERVWNQNPNVRYNSQIFPSKISESFF